jgi:hypothetical protein
MNRAFAPWLLVVLAICACGQDKKKPNPVLEERTAKVRKDRERFAKLDTWIYDDLPRATAVAKATGKPLLVVFRCVPCEACVKIDDEVIEADANLQKLLGAFVCCRVPHANGIDLSVFQFDFDQSWAAFVLNADMTVYCRYGTRSHQTKSDDDVSVEGFAKALEGALALHADYPKNEASLAAKRGAPLAAKTPEEFPSAKGRWTSTVDWEGRPVQSCMHCHQVAEAERLAFRDGGLAIPEKLLFPYPNPSVLGLVMNPKERARVQSVVPGSSAEKDGFAAGDEIAALEGQPILSTADIQWVLHGAGDSGKLQADVVRAGARAPRTLTLAPGWRRKSDLSWRASTWDLRRMAMGGLVLEDFPPAERAKAGLPVTLLGLRVKTVGQWGSHAVAKQAGFREGDIIVAIDGKVERMTESELLGSLAARTKPGDKVLVTVLRGGQKIEIALPIQ